MTLTDYIGNLMADLKRFFTRRFDAQAQADAAAESATQRLINQRCDVIEKRLDALQAQISTAYVSLADLSADGLIILKELLVAVTPQPATDAVMIFEFGGKSLQGEMMKVTTNQTGGIARVILKRKDGGPGAVDGVPTFVAVPDGVLTLKPPTAETSPGVWECGIDTAASLPGGAAAVGVTVTFTADSDLGDGVKPFVRVGLLTVVDESQAADTGEMTFSSFTDVTPPPPPAGTGS